MTETTITQRTFPQVMDEWTEVCLEENRKADLVAVATVLRLGTKGQRLLYEAYKVGLREGAEAVKGASDGGR